jgi:hypothetical protein
MHLAPQRRHECLGRGRARLGWCPVARGYKPRIVLHVKSYPMTPHDVRFGHPHAYSLVRVVALSLVEYGIHLASVATCRGKWAPSSDRKYEATFPVAPTLAPPCTSPVFPRATGSPPGTGDTVSRTLRQRHTDSVRPSDEKEKAYAGVPKNISTTVQGPAQRRHPAPGHGAHHPGMGRGPCLHPL